MCVLCVGVCVYERERVYVCGLRFWRLWLRRCVCNCLSKCGCVRGLCGCVCVGLCVCFVFGLMFVCVSVDVSLCECVVCVWV